MRQETNLSGEWEYVRVGDLNAPPAEGWRPIEVPGTIQGVNYERAWFRREFEIPDTMRNLRIVLYFGGVKYNSVVLVNGEKVGGHFGGYEPFDVDITAVAKVGGTNRLELGCHDWTGVFVDNETDFSVMRERPTRSRSVPKDKILAPIGGRNEDFGPWDDVKLRAHPAVYVKDLFIKPSVREKKLRVEYTLANLTGADLTVELAARVDDEGETPLALPGREVSVAAGEEVSAVLEAPWEDARCWSHEDPYLYFLQTTLKQDGDLVDDLRTRFGFREFWVEGKNFYLNGSRINLLATSWWPELSKSKEYIQERMRQIKAANCVVFRTHTQPWSEIWYETADEMGLMMIPEGAIWNDDYAYRIDDPKFWDNYAEHLKAMVDRDKNKPSVVMYSLENEMYGGRLNDKSPAVKDLARMGELMHEWDPTRPIMYESDGDPLGVADVVGVHYPHEYPGFTKWPNTAYWMDEPIRIGHMFLGGETEWLWDRNKPVYIGEFLWLPSSDPSWHTVFFGDDAYLDYSLYRRKGKGESWRMAIQAYRYYEIGGISPWTMVEGGPLNVEENPMYAAQKYAMQPIAAYIREYDHNFYSGDEITRTADVYNDVLSPSRLVAQWALMEGEKELHRGEKALVMEPGERQEIEFTETMPLVQERRELTLRMRVMRGGEQVFEDAKEYSVFPLPALEAPAGIEVGLYDPAARTASAVAKCGLQFLTVDDLAKIPARVKVLVVGAGALEAVEAQAPVIGGAEERRGLMDFVRAGGRALVLEQEAYPRGVLPARLTEHDSTMTFAQMPSHPLLAGLRGSDLKWWRPDNVVTAPEPVRPQAGAFKAVVVSGSRAGIAHAPLLELPRGRGTLVLSQMKIGERLGVEPAAAILLQNALDYLAGLKPVMSRTALYCPKAATREYLDGLRLAYTDITDDPSGADWQRFDLLIACGPLEGLRGSLGSVRELLARGGTILLHGITPAEFDALAVAPASGLEMIPRRGAATRIPGAHALSEFFANEDLYWLGTVRAAHSWATKPLATDMTDYVFGKSLEGKEITEYPHEVMTVAGAHTRNDGPVASLPSGGSTATVEIEAPRDGEYILGVVAGGTQAQGVWPAGAVTVDGTAFGAFACQKGELDTYTVFGNLTAGKHEVTIRFTNDLYNPPDEDRNLLVKALLVAQNEKMEGVVFLTSPAAVAVIKAGEGRIVVDNINWETAGRNTRKAARYISGLLTGLGAAFETTAATVLEAEAFEHDLTMNWYRTEGDAAYLGDSGYIVRNVECAQSGRYVFNVVASGTPVKDIYPIIAVEIDGKHVGEIELKSEGWRAYPLEVELAEGVREIKLIFTNDEWDPPDDRNLKIDKVEVYAAE